jgi:hypothetical protein
MNAFKKIFGKKLARSGEFGTVTVKPTATPPVGSVTVKPAPKQPLGSVTMKEPPKQPLGSVTVKEPPKPKGFGKVIQKSKKVGSAIVPKTPETTHVAGVQIPDSLKQHFLSGQPVPYNHPAREEAARFVTSVWRRDQNEGRRMSEKLLGIGEGGKVINPNVKPGYTTIKGELPAKKIEPGGTTPPKFPTAEQGKAIQQSLSGGLPEKTGLDNVAQESKQLLAAIGFGGGKSEATVNDLEKSKNVREQRKKVFGSWKTSPNSKQRAKQMKTLSEYAEKKYGVKVRQAKGKKSSSGKMINKPDLTTGYLEHIGNPDSLAHELAHLDMAPEKVAMKQFQEMMDKEWGAQNVKYGYKQQARVKDEYESTARENQIRRQLGLPAHAKGRVVKKPGFEMAADRPDVQVARKLPNGKYIAGGKEVYTPETAKLFEERESSNAKYSPDKGWVTKPSPHTAINLRGQGHHEEARSKAQAYFRSKLKKRMAKSDLAKNSEHVSKLLTNGRFAILTPHRSGAGEADNAAAHKSFLSDVASLGYSPLHAVGRWGGSTEPSYVVPGMSREHAIQLGKKYGQLAVIHGEHGQHEEIATHPSHKPMGIGAGHSEVTDPSGDHTEVRMPDGSSFKFRLNFPHPMAKNAPIQLEHYSAIKGLSEISPGHMGTGAPSQEYKRGLPEVARSYFYRAGSQPEDIVRSRSSAKYKVSLPHTTKIYDLAKDPDSHVKSAISDNGGAWNSDMILGRIRDAGYHGYTNSSSPLPNVVAMFHPVKVHSEEPA